MRVKPTGQLFLRALPALVLCLLATLFFSEAKLVKYAPSGNEAGEVHAGKLLPAQLPEIFRFPSALLDHGSTQAGHQTAWIAACLALLALYTSVFAASYPRTRPHYVSIESLPSHSLRPPPRL